MRQPGSKDRLIRLERRNETTDPAYGGTESEWTLIETVWARFIPQATREFYNRGFQAEATAAFEIYYREDLTNKDRIVFNSQVYEIIGLQEVGFREELTVSARALVP